MKCSFYLELFIIKAPAAKIQNEIRDFSASAAWFAPAERNPTVLRAQSSFSRSNSATVSTSPVQENMSNGRALRRT